MTKVFITGCARSGTTLLNRLFYAFQDIDVVDPEISIDDFCALPSEKTFAVAKRVPLTVLSVPLPEEEIQRQLSLVLQHRIRIINIVRDGRDVVHQHTVGPRVNPNRWIGCILQAQRFGKYVCVEVRYEELVTSPDSVQDQLCHALGLVPKAKFSTYPRFVPQKTFAEPAFLDFRSYDARPVDRLSIGHFPTEYLALCYNADERELFEKMLARKGYLNKEGMTLWSAKALEQELLQFRKLSRRQGYCN